MQTSKDVSHLATYSIDDAIPSIFLYESKEYTNLIESKSHSKAKFQHFQICYGYA